jgi:lipopolysaccharide transport system permease protein
MYTDDLLIEPGGTQRRYWRDLWRYRELFYFLAWRDILVRYKQAVAGASWALIRPFLTMLVLTLVFGKLAKMDSGGEPYPVLVFAGMLPWMFFSTAIAECGNSLVGNAALVSKVYFPRMTVPASSIVTSFVDFLISVALLVLLLAFYAYLPPLRVLTAPLFAAMAVAAAFGVGLWVSALTVKYRDFRFIVPFIVQFGLYISPVGYRTEEVEDRWRLLYALNPMVGVIDGFRWAILHSPVFEPVSFGMSLVTTTVLLVSGIWYFRKAERTFADTI